MQVYKTTYFSANYGMNVIERTKRGRLMKIWIQIMQTAKIKKA